MTWVRRLHMKACLSEPKTLPQLVSRLLEPGVAAGAEVDKRLLREVARLPWTMPDERDIALAPLLWAHVRTHGLQRRPWLRSAGTLLVTNILGSMTLARGDTYVWLNPYGSRLRTAEAHPSAVRRVLDDAPLGVYERTHAAAHALVHKLGLNFSGDSALKAAHRFLTAAMTESDKSIRHFVPHEAAWALRLAYYEDGLLPKDMLDGT